MANLDNTYTPLQLKEGKILDLHKTRCPLKRERLCNLINGFRVETDLIDFDINSVMELSHSMTCHGEAFYEMYNPEDETMYLECAACSKKYDISFKRVVKPDIRYRHK